MIDHELLGVRVDATAEELKVRFRELARVHHPDAGGDAVAFATLREAYERMLRRAPERRVCATCGGTRRMMVRRGFYSLPVTCATCDGSGENT